MAQPAMTEDQRIVAVALLANAIRKERRLRRAPRRPGEGSAVLSTFGAFGPSDGAAQYVRGMRDLLAVLFEGGRAVADACYEATSVEPSAEGQTDD